jgi:multiple sugar transport system substrate-binding protein
MQIIGGAPSARPEVTVRPRSRRRGGLGRLSTAGIAALAVATLAACSSTSSSASGAASGGATTASGGASSSASTSGGGSGAQVTLTYINAQDPGTFDAVIAGFEKANPNITIKLQSVPFDDLNTTVNSRLGAKDPSIDVYDVDTPRVASLAVRGYLTDLSDLGQQAAGKIDPGALKIGQYDGKQVAIPRWTSTQLLYFNKTVLNKAGIKLPSSDPKSPMTWQEVAAEGKKAQDAGAAKWGLIWDQVDRYYQLQPLPESLGGGPGLTGTGLLTPDITNAAWIKAFTWYGSVFKDGISPRGITPEQASPLFANGSMAFFAGGPWNAAAFDKAKVDYGVAPFPMMEGGKPASSTGSWATGISPFSKNQDAAKKFIEYMTIDPTGAFEMSHGNIPVQLEAQDKYLSQLASTSPTSALMAAIIKNESANNAVPRPTTVGYVDFETVMNKAFADIRNGSDPTQRLQSASDELKRVLAKYQQ